MSPLQSILLFEIQSVRVKFQLEIECFTLEFHIETSTAETHATIKIPHDLQQTHALWSSAKTTNPNLSVFCLHGFLGSSFSVFCLRVLGFYLISLLLCLRWFLFWVPLSLLFCLRWSLFFASLLVYGVLWFMGFVAKPKS